MSNHIALVPTKSDKEYADELKIRIMGAYKPLLEVLQEAADNSFIINCTVGQTQATGKIEIQVIQIMKGF